MIFDSLKKKKKEINNSDIDAVETKLEAIDILNRNSI